MNMRRRHLVLGLYVAAALFIVGAVLPFGRPIGGRETPTATVVDSRGVARTTTYPARTPTLGLTSASPLTVENWICLMMAVLLTMSATALLVRGASYPSPSGGG